MSATDTAIWKSVRDTRYSVSNTGLVRNDRTGRILRQNLRDEYACVKLMTNNVEEKPLNARVHRLVASAFCPNPDSKPYVDHIDCDPTNNNACNLRWCTAEESARNKRKSKKNTSGRTGVYWNTASGKWMAYIREGGHMTYLGVYDDIEQASFVRDTIAAEIYGDFFHPEGL